MGTVRVESEGDFVLNLMHLKNMPKFGLHLIYMKSVVQYRYIYIYIYSVLEFNFFMYRFFFLFTAFPGKRKMIKYKAALSV